MSATKAVEIDGHTRWVWSDTHGVVVALMAEVGAALEFVPDEWVEDWRVWACVADLPFATAESPTAEERETLRQVLLLARDLAAQRGDVTEEQVRRWRLGGGLVVCGGSLRTDPVRVEQVVEVIDEFVALLGHDLGPQRPLGAPRTGSGG